MPIARGRDAGAAVALVVGIPALSMLVLAGPGLLTSGLAAPLQPGWRGAVLAAGSLAVLLTLLLAALLAGAPVSRRARAALAAFGGSGDVAVLLVLGGAACWATSAACG